VKTTQRGHQAENEAAKQMRKLGYEILSQNWRTARCEIDIVAQKGKIVYFVEVKFRASSAQGEGLEYITEKKLSQMRFAARIWVQQNNWDGDWRLAAIGVTTDGQQYLFGELVELR
jgi:putative endonuclease